MTYCCPFNSAEDLALLLFVIIPFISFLLPDPDNRKSDSRYQPLKDKHITDDIDLGKMGANDKKQNYAEVEHE